MAAKKVNIRKLKFKKQAKWLEYSASFYFQPLLPQLQSHFFNSATLCFKNVSIEIRYWSQKIHLYFINWLKETSLQTQQTNFEDVLLMHLGPKTDFIWETESKSSGSTMNPKPVFCCGNSHTKATTGSWSCFKHSFQRNPSYKNLALFLQRKGFE